MKNPENKCIYTCKILDGGFGPQVRMNYTLLFPLWVCPSQGIFLPVSICIRLASRRLIMASKTNFENWTPRKGTLRKSTICEGKQCGAVKLLVWGNNVNFFCCRRFCLSCIVLINQGDSSHNYYNEISGELLKHLWRPSPAHCWS